MGRALETAALTPSSSELSGEALLDERYRITRRLGGGGMGEVYEVEHVRLKRHFALKLLRAELAAERELVVRFEREARAVAALHSDHVVSIVDSGTLSDGRPYFVMERLVGQDLKQILAETAELPVPRAVNLGIDICLGLHAAHSAGLVHRDLKPENVFVTRGDDARERCKLLDFGVVKLPEQDQTRPGALVGTARYMAPEQVQSGGKVTPAADLFALGVILYRCLSGLHPFAADTLERVLFRVMNDTPAPLPAHVPRGLAVLIEQALAKQAKVRPASALEFARALARFTPDPRPLDGIAAFHVATVQPDGASDSDITAPDATPVANTEKTLRPPRARRVAPLLGGASLLVVATLGVQHLVRRAPPALSASPPREPAPTLVSATTRPVPPAEPVPAALAPAEKIPEASAPPPLRSARPAAKAAPSAVSKSPEATPSAAPATSAGVPAPSARPASLDWFDSRNPYGR